jgi:hypothetical protein
MSGETMLRRIVTTLTAMACLSGTAAGMAGAADVTNANYQPLPAAVVRDLAVPVSTLDAVGAGKPNGQPNQAPRLSTERRIREDGKPEVAYVLGEFCPYCAGESWALAVALSRFGTFIDLETLTSNSEDAPPSIQTISFRRAAYESRYLAFDPIVDEDANFKPVEHVPAKVMPAWNNAHNGLPFIDFGGRAELTTSSFSPTLLKGLSRVQIASDLAHAGRPVAQAIDGTANQLTAAICLVTGNKPGKVCRSRTVAAIQHSLRS